MRSKTCSDLMDFLRYRLNRTSSFFVISRSLQVAESFGVDLVDSTFFASTGVCSGSLGYGPLSFGSQLWIQTTRFPVLVSGSCQCRKKKQIHCIHLIARQFQSNEPRNENISTHQLADKFVCFQIRRFHRALSFLR